MSKLGFFKYFLFTSFLLAFGGSGVFAQKNRVSEEPIFTKGTSNKIIIIEYDSSSHANYVKYGKNFPSVDSTDRQSDKIRSITDLDPAWGYYYQVIFLNKIDKPNDTSKVLFSYQDNSPPELLDVHDNQLSICKINYWKPNYIDSLKLTFSDRQLFFKYDTTSGAIVSSDTGSGIWNLKIRISKIIDLTDTTLVDSTDTIFVSSPLDLSIDIPNPIEEEGWFQFNITPKDSANDPDQRNGILGNDTTYKLIIVFDETKPSINANMFDDKLSDEENFMLNIDACDTLDSGAVHSGVKRIIVDVANDSLFTDPIRLLNYSSFEDTTFCSSDTMIYWPKCVNYLIDTAAVDVFGSSGKYFWRLKVFDASGNDSTQIGSFIYDNVIPIIEPPIAFTSCEQPDTLIGPNWQNKWNDPAFKFSPIVIGPSNAIYYIAVNSDSNHYVDITDSITYNSVITETCFQVFDTLAQGTWYCHIRPTSGAGNVGEQVIGEFRFDKTKPIVRFEGPLDIRQGKNPHIGYNCKKNDPFLPDSTRSGILPDSTKLFIWYKKTIEDGAEIKETIPNPDCPGTIELNPEEFYSGWYRLGLLAQDYAKNLSDTTWTETVYTFINGVPPPNLATPSWIRDSIKICWDKVKIKTVPEDSADFYQIQLDTLVDFSKPVGDVIVDSTQTCYTFANLLEINNGDSVFVRARTFWRTDTSEWTDSSYTFNIDKEPPNVKSITFDPEPETRHSKKWIKTDTFVVLATIQDTLCGSVDSVLFIINDEDSLLITGRFNVKTDTVFTQQVITHNSTSKGCGEYSVTVSAHDTVCNWGDKTEKIYIDTHLPQIIANRIPNAGTVYIRTSDKFAFSLDSINVSDPACSSSNYKSGIDTVHIFIRTENGEVLLDTVITDGGDLFIETLPIKSPNTRINTILVNITASDSAGNDSVVWDDQFELVKIDVMVEKPVSSCFGQDAQIKIEWLPDINRSTDIYFSNDSGKTWYLIISDTLNGKYLWDVKVWLDSLSLPIETAHTKFAQIKVIVHFTEVQSDSDSSDIFVIDMFPPEVWFTTPSDSESVCVLNKIDFSWDSEDPKGHTPKDSIYCKFEVVNQVADSGIGLKHFSWIPQQKGWYKAKIKAFDFCHINQDTLFSNVDEDSVSFYVLGKPALEPNSLVIEPNPKPDSIFCPGWSKERVVNIIFKLADDSETADSVSIKWYLNQQIISTSHRTGLYSTGETFVIGDTIPKTTNAEYLMKLEIWNHNSNDDDCWSDSDSTTIFLDTHKPNLIDVTCPPRTPALNIKIGYDIDGSDSNRIIAASVSERNLQTETVFDEIIVIEDTCRILPNPFKYTIRGAKTFAGDSIELTIKLRDFAGNWSIADTCTTVVDTTRPYVLSISPQNGEAVHNSEPFSIKITFNEPVKFNDDKCDSQIELEDIYWHERISFGNNCFKEDSVTFFWNIPNGLYPGNFKIKVLDNYSDKTGNSGRSKESIFYVYISSKDGLSAKIRREQNLEKVLKVFVTENHSFEKTVAFLSLSTNPTDINSGNEGFTIINETCWEVIFKDSSDVNSQPTKPVPGYVQLGYSQSDVTTGVIENEIRIMMKGDDGFWHLLPCGTVNSDSNYVTYGPLEDLNGEYCLVKQTGSGDEILSNYPNPFSAGDESTTIRFTLKKEDVKGNNKILIYDAFGNLVCKIPYPAKEGLNEVDWDGLNGRGDAVANGGYLCFIQLHGNNKYIRKIAVVKQKNP